MFPRILAGLLTFALLQTSVAFADEAIRVTTVDGKRRAELNLNPDSSCIVENDHISCGRASR